MKSLLLQRKAQDVLSMLGRIDSETEETGHTLGRFICFLATRHPNPVGFDAIGEELGITKSQVSRSARGLHKLSHHGEAGLDLIDIQFDIHNPRIKLCSLNAQGLASVERIIGA